MTKRTIEDITVINFLICGALQLNSGSVKAGG
jgi:hypothetical protein